MTALTAARVRATVGSGRRSPARGRKWRNAGASALLAAALWQFLATFGGMPAGSFPGLGEIGRAAATELTGIELWVALYETLSGALIGLGIAIGLGLPIGVALGTSDAAFRACRFVLEFLRATPAPAILPVMVLLLGSGIETQVVLVAFGCIFPVLLQAVYGVRDIDPLAIETARAFQVSRWRTFWSVTLPSSLPFAFTGIRLAGSIALLVAVAVEVLVWSSGLGAAINDAQISNRPATMYVFIVATGILGIVMNTVTGRVQRHFLSHMPSARAT